MKIRRHLSYLIMVICMCPWLTVAQSVTDNNGSNISIGDASSGGSSIRISGAPTNAIITKVVYAFRINHPDHSELSAAISLSSSGTSDPRHVTFRHRDRAGSGSFDVGMQTTVFNGDSPNRTFHFRVWDNETGNSGGYIDAVAIEVHYEISIPDRPNAPVVDVESATQINLDWSNVNGASEYEVYRALANTTSAFQKVGTTNSSSYIDTNLSPSTDYWYRVKACNDSGCSSQSVSSAKATTDNSPSIVITAPSSSGTIIKRQDYTIRWNYSGTENLIIDYRKITSWETITATARNGSYVWRVPDLHASNDQNNEIRIRSSTGAASEVKVHYQVTQGCVAPDIDSFGDNNYQTNGRKLTWSRIPEASMGYRVEYRKSGVSSWNDKFTAQASLPSVILTDLEEDTEYEYRVYSRCNNNETSDPSEKETFTTANLCGAPSNVDIYNIGENQASVRWNSEPGASSYQVEYIQSNQVWSQAKSKTVNSSLTNISGLNDDTSYEVRVKTIDATCTNEYSSVVSFRTKKKEIPAPTLSLVSPNSGAFTVGNQLDFSWNSTNQSRYGIYLFKGGTSAQHLLAEIIPVSVSSAVTDEWTIPATITDQSGQKKTLAGSDFKVQIVVWNSDQSDALSVHDFSDGFITINPPAGDFLAVSPSDLLFNAEAGNSSISVSSNVSWEVSKNANWFSVSSASGTGESTVMVAVQENQTTNPRSGSITVTGGGISRVITVNQQGLISGSNHVATGSITGLSGNETGSFNVNIQAQDDDKIAAITLVISQIGSENASISMLDTSSPTQVSYGNSVLVDPSQFGFGNGRITLGLWLRDANGNDNQATLDTKTIDWSATIGVNQAPTIPKFNAFPSTAFVGSPVIFQVTAGTDTDGDQVKVQMEATGSNVLDAGKFDSGLGEGGSTYTVPVTFNEAGTQEVFIITYDEHGVGSNLNRPVSQSIQVLPATNSNEPAITRVYTHLDDAGNPVLEAVIGQETIIYVEGEGLPNSLEMSIEDFNLSGAKAEGQKLIYEGVFSGLSNLKNGFLRLSESANYSFLVDVSSNEARITKELINGLRLQNDVENTITIQGEHLVANDVRLEFFFPGEEDHQLKDFEVSKSSQINSNGTEVIDFVIRPMLTFENDDLGQLITIQIKGQNDVQLDRFHIEVFNNIGSIESISPSNLLFVNGSEFDTQKIIIETVGNSEVEIDEIDFLGLSDFKVGQDVNLPYTMSARNEFSIPIISTGNTIGSGQVVIRYNQTKEKTITISRVDNIFLFVQEPKFLDIINQFSRHQYVKSGISNVINDLNYHKVEIFQEDQLIFSADLKPSKPIRVDKELKPDTKYKVRMTGSYKGDQFKYTSIIKYNGMGKVNVLFPLNYFAINSYLINYLNGDLALNASFLSQVLLESIFDSNSIVPGYQHLGSVEKILHRFNHLESSTTVEVAQLGLTCHQLQLLAVYYSEADWYYEQATANFFAALKGLIQNIILAGEARKRFSSFEELVISDRNALISLEASLIEDDLEPMIKKILRAFSDNEAEIDYYTKTMINIFKNLEPTDDNKGNAMKFKGLTFLYDQFIDDFLGLYLRQIALKKFIENTSFIGSYIINNTLNTTLTYEQSAISWAAINNWNSNQFERIDWADIFKSSVNENEFLQKQKDLYAFLGDILISNAPKGGFVTSKPGLVFQAASVSIEALNNLVNLTSAFHYKNRYKSLSDKAAEAFANYPFADN